MKKKKLPSFDVFFSFYELKKGFFFHLTIMIIEEKNFLHSTFAFFLCIRLNPELHVVREVMSSPVVTITSVETVSGLAYILLTTSHSGFPVIKQKIDHPQGKYFHGLINRLVIKNNFKTIL